MRAAGNRKDLALGVFFFALSVLSATLLDGRFQGRPFLVRLFLDAIPAVPLFWLGAHFLKVYFGAGRPAQRG